MQFIGTICGTTNAGEFLIQLENIPTLNRKVHDRRKNEVGKVVYIFGNVISPYGLIRPYGKVNHLKMIGQEVYSR